MKRGGNVSGAVSLVMIFCVLCLAVFSVLTLVTAKRESDLSGLTAERAAAYYEADREAVQKVLLETQGPGDETEFSLPAGGEQNLEVLARRDASGRLIIEKWKTVYGGSWELNDTIELWDGF